MRMELKKNSKTYSNSKTPSGKPIRSPKVFKAIALNGVNSDGFTIDVQPVAKAGPTFLVIIASGKFHGVIIAVTPIASLNANIFPFGASLLKKVVGVIVPPPADVGRTL